MSRHPYIIILLFCLSAVQCFSQENISVAAGLGTTHFYGSVSQTKNTDGSFYLDGRYQINPTFSTSLSYGLNLLQAERYVDDIKVIYFNTAASALDLHFGINIMPVLGIKKLDIIFDFGTGLIVYKPKPYRYQKSTDSYIPDLTHIESLDVGAAFKVGFGGEIAYPINNDFSIFGAVVVDYLFGSSVDGYAHYAGDPSRSAKNDVYYRTSFGVRYNLDAPPVSYDQNPQGNQRSRTHRFSRFTEKYRRRKRLRRNIYKENRTPYIRWEEKKKGK